MSWVNSEHFEEYLSVLSDPPTQFVRDEYTDSVSFELDNTVTLDTTIIASEPWLNLETRPEIIVKKQNEKNISIREDDLLSLAKLVAYQQDGKTELSETDIEEYMWNGLTYVVESSVDFSSAPSEIVVSESDFYSVISHTSRLVGDVLSDNSSNFRSERNNHFDTTGSLARNIGSFYRPLGGTYLTVVLDSDGTYYLLIGNRSDRVVFWPELLTAFPAGYFKPTNITFGGIIDQHLLSEYSREAMDSGLHSKSSDKTKGVNAISQLLRANKASFEVTGFGIEAFSVSAELTGVLLIENPEYTEYLFENLQDSYDLSHVTAIPITENTTDKFKKIFSDGNMTPQTAFALGTGLKYLKEQTDVPIPFEISPRFTT